MTPEMGISALSLETATAHYTKKNLKKYLKVQSKVLFPAPQIYWHEIQGSEI